MRQIMIATVFALWLPTHGIATTVDLHPTPEMAVSEVPTTGPIEQRLKILEGLRRNDSAALIDSMGRGMLEDFLSDGSDISRAELDEKIAEGVPNDHDEQALQLWTLLMQGDGVQQASALWYPRWQAYIPQALAAAQLAVVGMGEGIASSTRMSALERAQFTELQWALTGWLARTDFSDRRSFEKVLGLARNWILASGAKHPLELALTGPEKRLQLADQGLRSLKQALTLYGLDAHQILGSVRVESQALDAKTALVRTSLTVLDVPLSIEERLIWRHGRWLDAGVNDYRQLRQEEAEAKAEAEWSATDNDTAKAAQLHHDD